MGGHLDVLIWASRNGCMLDGYTIVSAINEGHLHILQWMYDNNYKFYNWTYYYILSAEKGHMNILRWLYGLSCSLDKSNVRMYILSASYAAIRKGHMSVFDWCLGNGCMINRTHSECAVENGNITALKWLIERGCEIDSLTCANSAMNGNIDMLKWLRNQNCPWDSSTIAVPPREDIWHFFNGRMIMGVLLIQRRFLMQLSEEIKTF